MEELLALRHDEREFRRRWLARVDAWCKSLGEGGSSGDEAGGKAREVIRSVLEELAALGESEGSPLALETRQRLEAASGVRTDGADGSGSAGRQGFGPPRGQTA